MDVLCLKISLRTLCNSPEIKTLVTHCRSQNACTKMSRRSRSFFSELVNATTKKVLHDGKLSFIEGLGNVAKVYLIKCSQSMCAKLKKYEFCPVGHGGIAHIYIENSYQHYFNRFFFPHILASYTLIFTVCMPYMLSSLVFVL